MRQEYKVLRKMRGLIDAATKAVSCLVLAAGLAVTSGAQTKDEILREYLATIENCDIPT